MPGAAESCGTKRGGVATERGRAKAGNSRQRGAVKEVDYHSLR